MGKSFWPIFLIVAALGAATVWTQAPRHVTRLPDGLRSAMRSWVRTAQGLPSLATPRRPKDEPLVLLGGNSQQPQNAAPVVAPAAAAAPVTAPTAPMAAPVVVKSVHPATPAQADWCVLKETTPVQSLDDKVLSNAPGGRFFLIERRARAPEGGTLLIGNFTPKKLPHTVQVNSRHVLCLSGSPDDLTTAQLHALKMYYQLRAEAVDYLAEVRKSKGDTASPLYKQLQEAERIRDFRAKELKNMTTLAGDQRAVEMEELARLEQKAKEIRELHEDWKRAHRDQVSDPTKDPHYLGLVRECRNYISAMPAGLAVD